VFKLKGK